nr:hypothetical protein [uncultured Flavobacterium sp.]
MEQITVNLTSNEHLYEILDKKLDVIYVHTFSPNDNGRWKEANIDLGIPLKNTYVKEVVLDIKTDLEGLKQLISLNTHQLLIYQFNKSLPDALSINRLPEENRLQILKQNGLQHSFFVNYEFVTVSSFDNDFISILKKQIK